MPGDVVGRPHANCYWLIPGRLLAGEHPGAMVASEGVARVDALLDSGVRQFIDLTAEHEGPGPYVPILFERAAARSVGVAHRRSAIADFGVPSPELMRGTLDAIYVAIDAGETLYVHCWSGVRRTGTAAASRRSAFTEHRAQEILSLRCSTKRNYSIFLHGWRDSLLVGG